MKGFLNPQVDRLRAVHEATKEHAIAGFLWDIRLRWISWLLAKEKTSLP